MIASGVETYSVRAVLANITAKPFAGTVKNTILGGGNILTHLIIKEQAGDE